MEEWKNKVMNSLEGIERAEPPRDLFASIQDKISDQQLSTEKSEKRRWVMAAATVALVICANVAVIKDYYNVNEMSTEAQEYPQIVSSYNIYE